MDELDAGVSMPIIKILQKSAAEVDKDHENYSTKKVEGAEPGDLYFMGDSQLLSKPVEFLPLSQKTIYAEWRPMTAGGGLVKHHSMSIVADDNYRRGDGDKKNKEYLGDNELVLTIYFFVLFKDADEWKKAIIPFQSSNLKHGRALAKQIRSFRYADPKMKPFIFSRSFNLETHLERGMGNSWYEFSISPNRELDLADKEDKSLIAEAVEAHNDAVASLPAPEPVKAIEGEADPF